jgi:hypothetical protein
MKLTESKITRLLNRAAFTLETRADQIRTDARREHGSIRIMLNNDARRLDAIARNIRLQDLPRVRELVGQTDTAVREGLPAIVVNLCSWHTVQTPCYCADCAEWPVKPEDYQ